MKELLKFIFAWWDTPMYLWSIKTLAGFICMILIPILPFAIIESIIDEINNFKKKREHNKQEKEHEEWKKRNGLK